MEVDQGGISLQSLTIKETAPSIQVNATAAYQLTASAISVTANVAYSLMSPINLITGSAVMTIAGGSLMLAAPTVAASLTGLTPAGIPII